MAKMRLFFSPLTGHVYASQAYREMKGNPGTFNITGNKYDVTDDFLDIIERRKQWQDEYEHPQEGGAE